MKIQCSVCEGAEAAVLCCADEAALCWSCDEKVHAANKLASKHQRVALSTTSSQMPSCDICQETVGYFFCLEDRALLCRKCDVAIHTVNTIVSSHQRFLLTGVKVELESADPVASSSSGRSRPAEKISEAAGSRSMPRSTSLSASVQYDKAVPVQAAGSGNIVPPQLPFAGGSSAESVEQWQFDAFLGLTDFDQNYNYINNGSSKADSGKLGDSDGSPILRAMEVEKHNEGSGLVADASLDVPEIHTPHTASGLWWPKSHHRHAAAFVPDVSYSPLPTTHHSKQTTTTQKRRR